MLPDTVNWLGGVTFAQSGEADIYHIDATPSPCHILINTDWFTISFMHDFVHTPQLHRSPNFNLRGLCFQSYITRMHALSSIWVST